MNNIAYNNFYTGHMNLKKRQTIGARSYKTSFKECG